MKNFHVYNDFFKIVTDENMVILFITSTRYNNINIYKIWLINLDWFVEISRLKNLNLSFFKV